jgi:ubiquinone/menaquinone biosynthesis C-methylase UbiE
MTDSPIAAGKSSFNLIDHEVLFAEMALQPDMVFLDAACGAGAYSLALADRMGQTGKLYAVDLWSDGIATLSREIAYRGIRTIEPAVADISKHIPVDNASVDVCLLATAFHDLVEDHTDQGALREIKRVLKQEGLLLVIEFKKIEGPPGPPLRIRLSPDELEQALAPHRFVCIKTVDAGPFTYLSLFRNTI